MTTGPSGVNASHSFNSTENLKKGTSAAEKEGELGHWWLFLPSFLNKSVEIQMKDLPRRDKCRQMELVMEVWQMLPCKLLSVKYMQAGKKM